MRPHVEALLALRPCGGAIDYAADYATAQEAWDACTRPNWLAWLIARLNQRQGALIACLCARSVVHLAGQHRDEIEGLLSQIESWAWGADGDMKPVRERLWTIYRAARKPSTSAAAFAASATTIVANADDDIAACAADDAAYDAVDAAAYDPTDLCNLIRAAVPVCPTPPHYPEGA